MEFVLIGKIVNTFGIRGELKVESYTDFEAERYKKGSSVYLGEEHLEFKVKSFRNHKGFLHVLFENYEDINLVLKFKNYNIYKAKEDIKPLKRGEYYFSDLKDLDIYVNDVLMGHVLNVEEGMTSNYLRVSKNDKKEVLIPYLPQFILNVNLDDKRIDVVDMEGLL